jgi:hypothetical protein
MEERKWDGGSMCVMNAWGGMESRQITGMRNVKVPCKGIPHHIMYLIPQPKIERVRFISVETRNGGRVAAVFAAYRDHKAVVSTLAPGAYLPDLLKQITGGARECRCTVTGERRLFNHLF